MDCGVAAATCRACPPQMSFTNIQKAKYTQAQERSAACLPCIKGTYGLIRNAQLLSSPHSCQHFMNTQPQSSTIYCALEAKDGWCQTNAPAPKLAHSQQHNNSKPSDLLAYPLPPLPSQCFILACTARTLESAANSKDPHYLTQHPALSRARPARCGRCTPSTPSPPAGWPLTEW